MDDWLHNLGSHGIDSHDEPRAVHTWRWMNWALLATSLLTIPAFYLELTEGPPMLRQAGQGLYSFVAAGFGMSLAWLLHLSRRPRRLLLRNWLDVLITCGAAASVAGGETPWTVLEWGPRIVLVCVVALRIAHAMRALLVRNRLLLLFGIGAAILAVAGAGFYWLEPRVHSYAEGLWLAFESSATVGYGDVAPTTPASRVFAVFVVLLGYGMLSLVFASIAAMFVGEEEKGLRRDMHRDIKRLEGEIICMRGDLHALRLALDHAEVASRRGSNAS